MTCPKCQASMLLGAIFAGNTDITWYPPEPKEPIFAYGQYPGSYILKAAKLFSLSTSVAALRCPQCNLIVIEPQGN